MKFALTQPWHNLHMLYLHSVTWTELPSFSRWHFKMRVSERLLSHNLLHIPYFTERFLRVHLTFDLYLYWVTNLHNRKFEIPDQNIGQLKFQHGQIITSIKFSLDVITSPCHYVDGGITCNCLSVQISYWKSATDIYYAGMALDNACPFPIRYQRFLRYLYHRHNCPRRLHRCHPVYIGLTRYLLQLNLRLLHCTTSASMLQLRSRFGVFHFVLELDWVDM